MHQGFICDNCRAGHEGQKQESHAGHTVQIWVNPVTSHDVTESLYEAQSNHIQQSIKVLDLNSSAGVNFPADFNLNFFFKKKGCFRVTFLFISCF